MTLQIPYSIKVSTLREHLAHDLEPYNLKLLAAKQKVFKLDSDVVTCFRPQLP